MVKRAGRGAFCAAPVARGVSSLGGGTQGYAVHIFRLAIPDRLRALRGGAFGQALRVDGHHARSRTNGETDAGDVAFRHVAARLLAVGTISEVRSQRSEVSSLPARRSLGE